MKIVTIILIAVGVILSIYLLSITLYILMKYVHRTFERIDLYFDLKDMAKEQEEIYKFKKNL